MRRRYAGLLIPLALHAAPARAQVSDRALWAGGAAAVAGALLLDRAVDRSVAEGGGERFSDVTRILNYGGRPQIAAPLLGAAWAAGELGHHPPLARGVVRVGGGLLAAGVVNGAVKYSLGRARPSITDRPDQLRPFNGDNAWQSFPSGHATVAFALATGIAAEARRPWVSVAAYSGASLVAWSRVYDDKHWTSDVVGGALIGVGVTRAAMRTIRRAQGRGGAGVTVSPLPNGIVLGIPVD